MHSLLIALFWCAITLGLYQAARRLHRRYPAWWSSPLLVTWLGCLALVPLLHSDYRHYMSGTWWMVTLLGPATVAFAVPIYEQRHVIRRHWKILAIGVMTGTGLSIGTSWVLATLMHFSPELEASLLPRSITTAFAMAISSETGGVPGLTASFTAITGLFGAALGGGLLRVLRIDTAFARGAFLGAGAHGAGVVRAYQLGREEGSIASTVMVLAGLLNVVGAALVMAIL